MQTPPGDQTAPIRAVAAEVPLPANHLLNAWRLPPGLVDQRYGVASFHHPALVAALREIGPTGQLELILIRWLRFYDKPLEGSADEIRQTLIDYEGTKKDAANILSFTPVVGRYLAELAKSNGGQLAIERNRTSEGREWRISLNLNSRLDQHRPPQPAQR